MNPYHKKDRVTSFFRKRSRIQGSGDFLQGLMGQAARWIFFLTGKTCYENIPAQYN